MFAPVALNEPATLDTVMADALLAAIYEFGIFHVVLQAGAGRPTVARHRAPDVSDVLGS